MTRKRYVKLLMALGVRRNRANAMAYACQVAGKSYAADYRYISPWLKLAKAARETSNVVLNMAKAFNRAATAAGKLRDSLVVHHAQPITPENLEYGKMYVVTKQEHDRLHGYSANVCFVDENHQAPRHDDALDALSYAALIAGRGNGRTDANLTEKHFKKISDVSLVASGGYPLGGGGNE